MVHDDLAHAGFHRAYAAITETLYIRRLAHYLRQYIGYYPDCLLNQTKRHSPYGSLNPISTPKIPFHTITMDFILALPLSGQTQKFVSLLQLHYRSSTSVFWEDETYDEVSAAFFLIGCRVVSSKLGKSILS